MQFAGRLIGNASLTVGSDGAAGRAAALALVGVTPAQAVVGAQVHGAGVAVVDAADAGRGAHDHADAIPDADALVTAEADLALVVLAADCVPVLFTAPGAVAAAHAGRRGVEAGVITATVTALCEVAGAAPQAVTAVVGPAIGGCCYEVPAALAAAVAARWPAAAATTTWGTPALDLPAAAVAQLDAAGVGKVERAGECTRCHHERWFSHRASQDPAIAAPPGRNAAIVLRSGGKP